MSGSKMSQSQFGRATAAAKRHFDLKTVIQFVLYTAMIMSAFFMLRERVTVNEIEINHLDRRMERIENREE